MTVQRCTKCGVSQSSENFLQKEVGDKKNCWCRACIRYSQAKYARKRYRQKTHLYRERDKLRKPKPILDKAKFKAQSAVRTAVYKGRLSKPDACEICGKVCIAHGHHEDYSKPLSVTWLCPACHAEKHSKYKFTEQELSA